MKDLGSDYYKLDNLPNEEWAPLIEGYEISNMGRVKSLTRVINRSDGFKRPIQGRILRPAVGTNGYLHVNTGLKKCIYIHRIVAINFCDGYSPGLVVDHINNDKLDNRASNLRWIPQIDNTRKSMIGAKRNNSMEHNPRSKAVNGFANGIIVETYKCAKMLSEKYSINYSTLKSSLRKGAITINGIIYQYK